MAVGRWHRFYKESHWVRFMVTLAFQVASSPVGNRPCAELDTNAIRRWTCSGCATCKIYASTRRQISSSGLRAPLPRS